MTLAVIEPRRDSLGNYEQPLRPGPPTDLGWMLSCSGVHPEAVKIVEAYQADVERLREDNERLYDDNQRLWHALVELDIAHELEGHTVAGAISTRLRHAIAAARAAVTAVPGPDNQANGS